MHFHDERKTHDAGGDLLLEMGQGAAALTEYETALQATPNRFRGFSWELPAPPPRRAIGRRHPSITASSWSWPRTPIRSGTSTTRRTRSRFLFDLPFSTTGEGPVHVKENAQPLPDDFSI